jgi:hypothetical protein
MLFNKVKESNRIGIKMAQPANVSHELYFHHNYQGDMLFYNYDGTKYAPTFPLVWAKDHLTGTGPESCAMCKTIGYWNGVFVGYCVKCAEQYNCERGNGFIFYGEEKRNKKNLKSARFTYMKDVDLNEIGNKEICDTQAIIDEINSYKQEETYETSLDAPYGSNYNGGYDSY